MRAICVGIDRVAGRCLVQFPTPPGSELQPEVFSARYRGEPPAPLTYVEMHEVSSGSWICNGSLANVEKRLLEDWDSVNAAGGYANGSTVWDIDSDMGSPEAGINPALLNYGSVRLSTSAVSGEYLGLNKQAASHQVDAVQNIAWWVEAKCLVEETTSRSFGVGLTSFGFDPFPATGGNLMVLSETATLSGQLRFRADDGVAANEVAIGYTPTANVQFIVHIMVMGSLWAAAWVVEASTAMQDLDTTVHGPFVLTANVLGDQMSPGFYLKTGAAAAKHASVDYFRVSTVHPVIHPSEVLSG